MSRCRHGLNSSLEPNAITRADPTTPRANPGLSWLLAGMPCPSLMLRASCQPLARSGLAGLPVNCLLSLALGYFLLT
jgi:hypothetical protein